MKAAVLEGPAQLKIADVPVPEPGYGEILVRVRATAICGTDKSIYLGKTSAPYPRILGHESAGEVVETGDGVSSLREGDRVVISPTSFCGFCPACLRAETSICENGGLMGREFDGTFAEYVVVSEKRAFKLPESISLIDATTLELFATIAYSQRKADIFPGSSVVVIGEGPAGMLQTQLAKLSGADPVIGISRSQWKLDMARDVYGADYVFNSDIHKNVEELTDGRGADYVIECVGKGETYNLATELVRPGGKFLAFGTTAPEIETFKSYSLYYKDLTIIGSRAMQPQDWPVSIKLAETGRIDLSTVVTHLLPLEDLEKGFAMKDDPDARALRIVIEL